MDTILTFTSLKYPKRCPKHYVYTYERIFHFSTELRIEKVSLENFENLLFWVSGKQRSWRSLDGFWSSFDVGRGISFEYWWSGYFLSMDLDVRYEWHFVIVGRLCQCNSIASPTLGFLPGWRSLTNMMLGVIHEPGLHAFLHDISMLSLKSNR